MRNREVAKFLLRLDFMVASVMFIAAFSILFMLIYSPFSVAAWFSVTDERSMIVTVAFYIVAVAAMLLSKVVMRSMQSRVRISTPDISSVAARRDLCDNVVIHRLYPSNHARDRLLVTIYTACI